MRGTGFSHGMNRTGGMAGASNSMPNNVNRTFSAYTNSYPAAASNRNDATSSSTQRSGDDYSIYVKNIPPEIEESGLRTMFRNYVTSEEPTRCNVKQSSKGLATNFGFVHYSSIAMCEEAISIMDGHRIGNNMLSVTLGKCDRNHRDRDGFGGMHPSRDTKKFYDHRAGDYVQARDSTQRSDHNSDRRETKFRPFTPTKNSPVPGQDEEHALCDRNAWGNHQEVCKTADSEPASTSRMTPNMTAPLKPPIDTSTPKPMSNGHAVVTVNNLPKICMPEKCKVIYVDGLSPLQFSVQLSQNKDLIENINTVLVDTYEESQLQGFISSDGDIVVARSEDEAWYRATVLSVSRDSVKVRYLDYGNTEDVPADKVRALTIYKDVMPQAIPCRLTGILPTCDWSEASLTAFCALVEEAGADMGATKVIEEEGVFSVNLTMPCGGDVADLLVRGGHAIRDGAQGVQLKMCEMELNQECEVILSHLQNYNELYISPYKTQDEVCVMMSEIRSFCSTSTPGGPIAIGDIVAAVYDGNQYRAVVREINGLKCTVYFADFGNCEEAEVNSVYKLPEQFFALPTQAIKCRLQDVEAVASPQQVNDFIKNNFPDSDVLTAVFLSKDTDSYVIDLKYKGASAVQELIKNNLCKKSSPVPAPGPAARVSPATKPALVATSADPPPRVPILLDRTLQTILPLNQPLEAALSYINAPSSIAFNFKTPDQDIGTLFIQEQVQQDGQNLKSFFDIDCLPVEEEVVIAFSDEYEEWFRGVVLGVEGDKCKVYSLDFGNTVTLSLDKVKPAGEEHAKLRPLAFMSAFQGAAAVLKRMDSKGEEGCAILQEILCAPFTVHVLSQNGTSVVIKPVEFDLVKMLKAKINPAASSSPRSATPGTVTPSAVPSAGPPITPTTASPTTSLVVVPPLPPGYTLVPTTEWESMILDVDRVKRILRSMGQMI